MANEARKNFFGEGLVEKGDTILNNVVVDTEILIKGNNDSYDLNALEDIRICKDNKSRNIYTMKNFKVYGKNHSYDITAGEDVFIGKDNRNTGDIFSGGNIVIKGSNCSKDLFAKGNITIYGDNESGYIISKGVVIICGNLIKGSVMARKVIVLGKVYPEANITTLN